MASALAIEGVTKVYGRTTVVDDVSFTVEPQEILGLVGPNGAGKTTTIRMALDIIHPDTGVPLRYSAARRRGRRCNGSATCPRSADFTRRRSSVMCSATWGD